MYYSVIARASCNTNSLMRKDSVPAGMTRIIFAGLGPLTVALLLSFCPAYFFSRNGFAATNPINEGRTIAAADTPTNRLLDSARVWVVKERLDLAVEAVQKARLIEPDNPVVLARLGELELKMNHTPRALELLQQLQSRYPETAATRELEDAYRIVTKDRMAMATVEFLSRVAPSRMEPAVRALQELFPQGAPSGDLGLKYYHILARANGHQAEAKIGIERMIKEMPADPRPQLELADLLIDNPATLLKGLDRVAALAQRDDINRDDVLKVWSDGLSDLERNPQTEPLFEAFEAAFPDVKPVPQKTVTEEELAARRQRQLEDQVYELIRNADAARNNQQPEEARRLLDKALQLNPANKEAQLSLAKIELALGNYAHAQELYSSVLQTDPVNARALNGMIDALAASGQQKQALEFAENYAQAHPQQAEDVAQARAGLIRAESDDLLKQGLTSQALTVLEKGLNDIPSAVWLRYDLANQYARMGFTEKSKRLFTDMPAASTSEANAENLYAEALFLSGQGDNDGAISVLERIAAELRSDSAKALLLKSSVRSDLAQAAQAQMKEKHSAAVKLLQNAETLAKDSPELTWECAYGWTEIGESGRGVALGKRILTSGDPSLATDNALRYARLLYKTGRDAEVSGKIAAIETNNDLTKQQKENLLGLKRMVAIRNAWELRRLGKPLEAEALLVKALEQQPDDPGLLITLADILYLADKPEQADVIYRKLIGENRQAFDARLAHVKALRAMGMREDVLDEISTLGREIPTTDRSNRRTLAEQFAEEKDFLHAREIINDVLRTLPSDKKTLLQAAAIEQKAKEYESALDFLRQAEKPDASGKPATLESAALAADAALQIQKIERRRYGYLTSGVDYRELAGTHGISQIYNIDTPVLIRYPIGYSGHVFVQADSSTVLAGQLNVNSTNFSSAAQFGKINALCNSSMSCNNNTVQLSGFINQAASGAPIAIGYQNDDWRFDIGSSPLGFPVNTVIGGVNHSGSWGKVYYSWNLARRPLANSLLSYSGAHDPVTGEVWGGVKANGGGIYMGTDYGRLGLFAQGAAHYIEGKNVRSNQDIMLRTGADWNLIDDEDMRLSVGIAGMYWRFANDQRHYTFGYGGYWSPQTYLSIAPPIQWTGRWGDLSYLFRGYVSYSWSSEGGGAYYPISPDLQYSSLNNNALYTGSSGLSPALSFGVRSVLEYQVAPQWFLGGRAEYAQSPFYTPNYFGLYFRFAFDERKEKIPYPPEQPAPYYRY